MSSISYNKRKESATSLYLYICLCNFLFARH
nr:MAG TPA: hypothetical protein [Ackermannviridae sp.]